MEPKDVCPYHSGLEEKLEAIKKDTEIILITIQGTNGQKGYATRLALLEDWMEKKVRQGEAWMRPITAAIVTFAVMVIVAVVVAAASGIIKIQP